MNIMTVLKEHFSDVMTPEVEKKIKDAIDLMVSEKVSEKTEEIKAILEEEKKLEIQVELEELEERLDTYITKANEELIDEHLKNVESKTKVEIAESIYTSVIKALQENDMNIAVEQKDIISQLEEENKKLENSLDESIQSAEYLKKTNAEYEKAVVFTSMTESLTDTQKDKVMNMIKNVITEDIEDFKAKVKTSMELINEHVNDDKDLNEKDDKDLDEKFDKKVVKSLTEEYLPEWLK